MPSERSSAAASSHFDRERLRHIQVNHAFAQLRTVIPSFPIDRKMSKHEILRGAIRYIHILEYILGMRSFSDLEGVSSSGN